jgi:hypothetical protein
MLEGRIRLWKFDRAKLDSSEHDAGRSIAGPVRARLVWQADKNPYFQREFGTLIVSCHPLDLRVM